MHEIKCKKGNVTDTLGQIDPSPSTDSKKV